MCCLRRALAEGCCRLVRTTRGGFFECLVVVRLFAFVFICSADGAVFAAHLGSSPGVFGVMFRVEDFLLGLFELRRAVFVLLLIRSSLC